MLRSSFMVMMTTEILFMLSLIEVQIYDFFVLLHLKSIRIAPV